MDEAVRIYVPTNRKEAVEEVRITKPEIRNDQNISTGKHVVEKNIRILGIQTRKHSDDFASENSIEPDPNKNSKWKFFSDGNIWLDVLKQRGMQQKELEEKYPWAEILHNWAVAALVVALAISFILWGIRAWSDNRATAYAEATLAGYQAEQQAVAQVEAAKIAAEKASEKANLESMTVVGQKMVYGIRNFIDKYHYSEKDIRTYIRCPLDRLDKELAAMTPEEREKLTYEDYAKMFKRIVSKEGQFLAYSDSNLPLSEYHDVIYNEIETWLYETSKPWDISYEFAELRPDGIFLSNQFGADGYARRVRY